MTYDQFYKGWIAQLRFYCNLPGNSQTKVSGNLDMKMQSFNDILNSSKGVNSKTEFAIWREMGVDHAEILKLITEAVGKKRIEFEEAEKCRLKKEN